MADRSLFSVSLDNYKEVLRGIDKQKENVAKAVNSTVKDFKSRGPGWISQEVTSEYAIKKKDITKAKRGATNEGSIRIGKVTVPNVTIKYSGRRLTPIHFQMSPKERPTKKKYKVKVTIVRGQKKQLPQNTFLASNGAGVQIPFQRTTDSSYPIKAIRTVSIPQMVTGQRVNEKLRKRINTEMQKRLEHHIERFNK